MHQNGATPSRASQNGHLDVVNALSEHGAARGQTLQDGTIPLWTATFNGHLDVVKALCEHGAAQTKRTRMTQLPPVYGVAEGSS